MKMKIKKITGLALMMILTISAYTQEPKTVTDFYLAMPNSINEIAETDSQSYPEDFFFGFTEKKESKAATIQRRKALIKIADLKNGYLRLESNQWEGWIEMSLFKKTNGTYLVAVSQTGCGPSCSGWIIFLTHNKGKWTNVTESVFPDNFFSSLKYFKLPRVGTTIELICGDESGDECQKGKSLDEFKWNKTKFFK